MKTFIKWMKFKICLFQLQEVVERWKYQGFNPMCTSLLQSPLISKIHLATCHNIHFPSDLVIRQTQDEKNCFAVKCDKRRAVAVN